MPMMNSAANVRPIPSQRARMTWKGSACTKAKVRNRATIVVRVSQKCMTRVVRGLPHHDGLRTTWSIRIRTGIPTIRVMMSKYPVAATVEHPHLFAKDWSLTREQNPTPANNRMPAATTITQIEAARATNHALIGDDIPYATRLS